MDKVPMKSTDLTQQNYEKLAALFPNAVTETVKDYDEQGNAIIERAIDADVLRQEISAQVVEGRQQRYQFTWPDKNKAIVLGNTPTTKTLRLDREKSVGRDGTKRSIDTENIYIEGDNLDALKILRDTYLGKVKMIYIDPPYNTGNDFIYEDDFSESGEAFAERSGLRDEDGNLRYDMKQNNEASGRFHTDWLNMMYPRLRLARDLLSDDGVIFISIDDNEQENLKKICDEVFGGINFLGMFVVNSSPSAIDYGSMAKMHDYALMYSKNVGEVITYQLEEKDKKFDYKDEHGEFIIYPLYNGNVAFNPDTRPNLYYPFYLNPLHKFDDDFYEIGLEPKDGWIEVWPVVSKKDGIPRVWRWGKEEKARKNLNGDIIGYKNKEGEWRIVQKYRSNKKTIRSLLLDQSMSSRRGTAEVQELFSRKVFSFPKPIELLKQFCMTATAKEDIILDFFSGSATTAHAVMQLNAEDGGHRKFIMVQLPERCEEKSEAYKAGYRTICEIGEERIRRAGKKIKDESPKTTQDLDVGFRVFRVDDSNMKDVYYRPDDLGQIDIEDMIDNIKPDRTPEDLLFQTMLSLGVFPSSKIEEITVAGKKVFDVADGFLLACFDSDVNDIVVTEIAKRKPSYAVFRDSGFADDAVSVNFDQIFREYSPNTERKVL